MTNGFLIHAGDPDRGLTTGKEESQKNPQAQSKTGRFDYHQIPIISSIHGTCFLLQLKEWLGYDIKPFKESQSPSIGKMPFNK
jgi:hypothetical protein